MKNTIVYLLALLMLANNAKAPAPITEYLPPVLDCRGEVFTVLHGEDHTLLPEELNGNVVNDAAFKRDRRAEELFNVELEELRTAEPEAMLRRAVLAGDDVISAMLGKLGSLGTAVLNGYFHDLAAIPELQLNGVWWNGSLNSELTVDGALFAAANDISPKNHDSISCLYYDAAVFGDEPLEAVRKGEWTLDKLLELMKKDSGVMKGGIAFTRADSAESLLLGSGASFIKKDGKAVSFDLSADMYDAADRVAELLSLRDVNAHSFMVTTAAEAFKQNYEPIYDKGCLLPLPKLDAEDDRYYCPVTDEYELLALPVTNADLSTSGILLNALQYYSSIYVAPAQRELDAKEKIGFSDEKFEMAGLIHGSAAVSDCDAYFCELLTPEELEAALEGGALAAKYAVKLAKAQKQLDDHLAFIREIAG